MDCKHSQTEWIQKDENTKAEICKQCGFEVSLFIVSKVSE